MFFAEANTVADVESVAKQQSLSVSHDLTFVLVTAADNADAANQVGIG